MFDHDAQLQEGETLDDLILGGRKLIQSTQGYRFSLDAVLLAHFPALTGIENAVDLGTGNGVIPILLSVRSPGLHMVGIELQPGMVDRAQRSVDFNRLQDRIRILQADIREIEKTMPGGCAELVLSNPPFWKAGQGLVSRHPEQAVARHELHLKLEELWAKGAYLLQPGGRMAVIQPVERLVETVEVLGRHKLQLGRMRLVHPFLDRPAGQVLLEAVKERRTRLTVLPPLVIYTSPGQYSPEIQAWYGRPGPGEIPGMNERRPNNLGRNP